MSTTDNPTERKQSADNDKENPNPDVEPEEKPKPQYSHKSALERLDFMKFQDVLDDAKNYYLTKFGRIKEFPMTFKDSTF